MRVKYHSYPKASVLKYKIYYGFIENSNKNIISIMKMMHHSQKYADNTYNNILFPGSG